MAGLVQRKRRNESAEDYAARTAGARAEQEAREAAERKVFTDAFGDDVDPVAMDAAKDLAKTVLTGDHHGEQWADIKSQVDATAPGAEWTALVRELRPQVWVRAYRQITEG